MQYRRYVVVEMIPAESCQSLSQFPNFPKIAPGEARTLVVIVSSDPALAGDDILCIGSQKLTSKYKQCG